MAETIREGAIGDKEVIGVHRASTSTSSMEEQKDAMARDNQQEQPRSQEPVGDGSDVEKTDANGAPKAAPSAAAGMPDFPDGGLRAWLVILGAACVFFVNFGSVSSFGLFETYYLQHQLSHKSSSAVSWIGTFQAFMMFSGGPFVGRLFDTYGHQPLMLIGSVLVVFAYMMTSLGTEYYQIFLSQGVAFGVGTSILFYPTIGCTTHWFAKKRGIALGLAASGSSIGGVVWPIILNRCLNHSTLGFGWSVRIYAFLFIPFLVVANLTVRTRLPRRAPGPVIDLSPFKQVDFSMVVIALFFSFWGMFVPYYYLSSFGSSVGLDLSDAFYLQSVLNATSFFGRIIPGIIADKLGRINLMVCAVLFSGVVSLAWINESTKASAWVLTAFFGFFSGAIISLQAAVISETARDMRKIGTMVGMAGGVFSLAALTGSPIAGAILDQSGSFDGAFGFAGASLCIAAVVFATLRFKLCPKLFAVK